MPADLLASSTDLSLPYRVAVRTSLMVLWVWAAAGLALGATVLGGAGTATAVTVAVGCAAVGLVRANLWARRLGPTLAGWVDAAGERTVATWLAAAGRYGSPWVGPRTLARRVGQVGQVVQVERTVRRLAGTGCVSGHWLGCPHLPADVDQLRALWPDVP